jgi:hypothetical protein
VKFTPNKPPPPPKFSRKDHLADWITAADNPFFAKAIANRLWALFLGRGLVHPVDNMSPANAPSHPALLDALTAEMKAHKFDVKHYIRELVNTKTYQLSSAGGDGSQFPAWFAAARVRPLSAEELAESWRTATGYEAVEEAGESKKNAKPGRFRPLESGYMIRFFGTPNTGTGDFQGGLQEHLYLNNGPVSTVLVSGTGSLLGAVSEKKTSLDARIQRLFVSLLNRRPTKVEQQRFNEFFKNADTDESLWREAAWALMTSSEFRFNH